METALKLTSPLPAALEAGAALHMFQLSNLNSISYLKTLIVIGKVRNEIAGEGLCLCSQGEKPAELFKKTPSLGLGKLCVQGTLPGLWGLLLFGVKKMNVS